MGAWRFQKGGAVAKRDDARRTILKGFGRYLYLATSLAVASAAVIGCGGGGGGGGTSGGSGSSGSTFALAGRLTVNGGQFGGVIPAGTQSFTLTDPLGHIASFSKVLVPMAMTSTFCTVIRAGSQLFSGTYGSTTAELIDQAGNQYPVPLNSNGTLAQDIGIDNVNSQYLALPVTSTGALTFQGGVQVIVDANHLGDNTKDVTLVVASPAAHVPSGSNENTANSTLSYTGGGTVNSTATFIINFQNSAQTASLTVSGSTNPPSQTVQALGGIVGSALPFSSSFVTYRISG